mgnify:CR=1 FL=1
MLYLIDFEWAQDLSEPKEWTARRDRTGTERYKSNRERHFMWLHSKQFPDPTKYSTFEEYIRHTL